MQKFKARVKGEIAKRDASSLELSNQAHRALDRVSILEREIEKLKEDQLQNYIAMSSL